MRLTVVRSILFCLVVVSTLASGLFTISCRPAQGAGLKPGGYECWLTTADKDKLFEKTSGIAVLPSDTIGAEVIRVDTAQHFQTMDGFGFALTGGSAALINRKLSKSASDSLLRELFLFDGRNIGISYLRISIGASDLDDHVFTYDDMPEGITDPELSKFSIDPCKKDIIPVLRRILNLNPDIRIMASPWSAPAWMKTNGRLKAGNLKSSCYSAFANYFVKYVQAMQAEGIKIDAITLQNEPENPKNNPSMLMTAGEQADFIKNNLGPAFAKAGIASRIIVFDHNCDHPEYPMGILDDAEANRYVDGTAFHLYLGKIEALSKLHRAHPSKNLYFTEQWTSPQSNFSTDLQWHVKNLIIGAPRNWSKNVLEWNLAADANFNPHTTDGGCTSCLGALTIDQAVNRNVSYYIIAHASKFVRPGSVRIASSMPSGLPNIAYVRPDMRKVLIVLNEQKKPKVFRIRFTNYETIAALPAGAVGTFIW